PFGCAFDGALCRPLSPMAHREETVRTTTRSERKLTRRSREGWRVLPLLVAALSWLLLQVPLLGSAVPSVAAQEPWTADASVSSGSLPAGQTLTISASVTAATAASALVDVELYGPSGARA